MTAREKHLVKAIEEQRRLSLRAKRLKDRSSYRHHRRQGRLLRIQLRKLMRSKRRLSRRDGRLEKRTERRGNRVDRIRARKGLKARANVKKTASAKHKADANKARAQGQPALAARYLQQAAVLDREAQALDTQAEQIPVDDAPTGPSRPQDYIRPRFQPRVLPGGAFAPPQAPPKREDEAAVSAEEQEDTAEDREDAAEDREDAADTGMTETGDELPFYKKPVVIIGFLALLGIGGVIAYNASKKGKNKSGSHAAQ